MAIAHIVLDIDGVIVGDMQGVNCPLPHSEVVSCLRKVDKNIPISLCTGRGGAVDLFSKHIGLPSLHAGDNGAILLSPDENISSIIHSIPKEEVLSLVHRGFDSEVYFEVYTPSAFYTLNTIPEYILHKRIALFGEAPTLLDREALINITETEEVIKILIGAKTPEEQESINTDFASFKNILATTWTFAPVSLPLQFLLFTAKGVSKTSAIQEILNFHEHSFEHTLGVGDTIGDWQFIEHCKYKACMGNATDELKARILESDPQHSYIGKSVNENGIIDILEHFRLV